MKNARDTRAFFAAWHDRASLPEARRNYFSIFPEMLENLDFCINGAHTKYMNYSIPTDVAEIGRLLAPLDEFWEHWGFESWSMGPFSGVSRVQRFVKEGILGPVAQYRAWDAIVWDSGTEDDRGNLWKTLRPLEDIMTQRFVFIVSDPWPERRIKSFFAGFKGYAEFYAYFPTHEGGIGTKDVKDLTGLVDMGIRLSKTGHAAPGKGREEFPPSGKR